jgi:hypothetical protein
MHLACRAGAEEGGRNLGFIVPPMDDAYPILRRFRYKSPSEPFTEVVTS